MRLKHRKHMDPSDKNGQATVAEQTIRQLFNKPGVLVVDDEHIVRILVELGLEKNGFDVLLAPNGREAIDLYREHRGNIALVLLDVRMPGLDGPETLEALREINPEVLACFMSGDTSIYSREELLQRGARYVITKPFLLDDLANILWLLTHGAPADLLPSGSACRV